ncbi:hypothetical protein N7520_010455 [Penicillium odoratum]|uniref:uncharacterized protein n=1 Tax=Penicillium odoratum TaxID=1167516 RepID=UPI0025490AC9|nr:uncharacterized protein N7520_010455 [Penicillium odoratum]KAJ5745273.1 hypothetical protein N7520_010455 [Penicillium odoratum]
MQSTISKALTLLSVISMVTATDYQTITVNTYYFANCSSGEISVNDQVYEGECTGTDTWPLKSILAYQSSGLCSDTSTSPVLYVYSETFCAGDPVASFDVTDEETCFELDDTVQGLMVECV